MTYTDTHDPEGGMSVSEVAALLDISPSTLRSWDRRYGVGASGRQTGQARLYRSADVDRLRRMRRLIDAGVAASEAARRTDAGVDEIGPRLSVAEFIEIAEGDAVELRLALEREVRNEGLIGAWTHLIEPALEILSNDHEGSVPGNSAEVSIYVALMQVEDAVVSATDIPGNAPRVTVLTWPDRLLLGTVVASAFHTSGLDVRLQAVPAGNAVDPTDFLREHLRRFEPHIVVVLQRLTSTDARMVALIEESKAKFVLISNEIPDFVHPDLQRVRSVAAGLEEVSALGEELGDT